MKNDRDDDHDEDDHQYRSATAAQAISAAIAEHPLQPAEQPAEKKDLAHSCQAALRSVYVHFILLDLSKRYTQILLESFTC